MDMFDDRMEPENLKSVAESIFGQQQSAQSSLTRQQRQAVTRMKQPLSEGGGQHPDTGFVNNLFGESLDLSPLQRANPPQPLREDLIQQAAQAVVKGNNDAFLAITQQMSPAEVMDCLKVARQWRRSDDDWQGSFMSAPETGFSFIDQGDPKKAKKKPGNPDKAESLCAAVAKALREGRVSRQNLPVVVRRTFHKHGVGLSESQVTKLCRKVLERV